MPPSKANAVSLEAVFNELKEIKQQLAGLPTLLQDVRALKNDIKDLKKSCEFNGKTINEHNARISTLEKKNSEIETLKASLDTALSEITSLKLDIADKEQRSRLNHVEIKGIPVKQTENLFTIAEELGKAVDFQISKSQINYIARVPTHNPNHVEIKGIPVKQTENLFTIAEELGKAVDFQISKSQINYIARVPTHNPKEKSIILSFNNMYVKEEFLAAGRARKSLTSSNIPGYGTAGNNIYINDHLTPANKQLLTKAKAACYEKSYQYVWVKHC
ncbi:hypothetical protein O0L34_g9355 [Tuta absoluta]|nr:hypothetical protein O0L34_g9355 [Tuta absoluta]